MTDEKDKVDWSKATWTGARLEELKRWAKLSLVEKLEAVEELNRLGDFSLEQRKQKGLAYIDPNTGNLVPPLQAAEEQTEYPSDSK